MYLVSSLIGQNGYSFLWLLNRVVMNRWSKWTLWPRIGVFSNPSSSMKSWIFRIAIGAGSAVFSCCWMSMLLIRIAVREMLYSSCFTRTCFCWMNFNFGWFASIRTIPRVRSWCEWGKSPVVSVSITNFSIVRNVEWGLY